MEINKKYLVAATEKAATEQLCDELTSNGFELKTETNMEGKRFDVLAKRRDEKVAYEIKSKSLDEHAKQQIAELSAITRRNGYSFKIVVAAPPKASRINVEGIRETLLENFINSIPDDFGISLNIYTSGGY